MDAFVWVNGETRGGAALGKHWRLGCLLRFCLVVGLCQKAVWYRIAVAVEADDLTSRVDTPSQCAGRAWEVERGEIRPSHAKGVYHSVDIDVCPCDLATRINVICFS